MPLLDQRVCWYRKDFKYGRSLFLLYSGRGNNLRFPPVPQLLRNPRPRFAFYQINRRLQDILHSRTCGKDDRSRGTIFTEIMDSDLPTQQFTIDRLMDEASGVVGAKIETTKWAFVQTCFHIIDNPPILQRLRVELLKAIPGPAAPPSVTELEQMPYPLACIEGGEHTHGFRTRVSAR